jgi:hypothetical protein
MNLRELGLGQMTCGVTEVGGRVVSEVAVEFNLRARSSWTLAASAC